MVKKGDDGVDDERDRTAGRGGAPRPGQPARGSTTGRPLMAALDLAGRRWALRIVWELRHGPLTFRALQERCDDASPSVLNRRLGELREARVVRPSTGQDGYRLTPLGQDLLLALAPLEMWARHWAAALDDADREPGGKVLPKT